MSYKLFIHNSIAPYKSEIIMDDWDIKSYTVTFLGQNRVNELKTIWTNKIPLNNEVNTKILDFMIKKKKNILGKEKQVIKEFIKKKIKDVTDQEIDAVFENIDNISKSGHNLIIGCQKCAKGVLSFKKWYREPYGDRKHIGYMSEEQVLDKALRKDKIRCQWCDTKIESIFSSFYNIYEVKKNYSVNQYYVYKKK